MDSIHPITPGPPAVPHGGQPPVERLERISRERDRPAREGPEKRRRQPPPPKPPVDAGDDEGRPRIDVRV